MERPVIYEHLFVQRHMQKSDGKYLFINIFWFEHLEFAKDIHVIVKTKLLIASELTALKANLITVLGRSS